MGLKPINEDMLDDIINKIKDSEIVKKIEDFFDDDEDSDDSKNSDDKSVGDKIKDFFKSVEKDPSKTDDMISPLCGTEYEWKVTSEFGDRTRDGKSEKHSANDLKAKQGTTLVSPFNGEIVDSTDNASDCGGMIKIKFDNGYEVSVVKSEYTYGGSTGLYELAVFKDGDICYDTPITDDVIGYLRPEDVTDVMAKVQQL